MDRIITQLSGQHVPFLSPLFHSKCISVQGRHVGASGDGICHLLVLTINLKFRYLLHAYYCPNSEYFCNLLKSFIVRNCGPHTVVGTARNPHTTDSPANRAQPYWHAGCVFCWSPGEWEVRVQCPLLRIATQPYIY